MMIDVTMCCVMRRKKEKRGDCYEEIVMVNKRNVKNQTHSDISHQMKVENVGLELSMLIKD
jgi:hypothetical protein